MPERQVDDCVIAVTHRSARVNARIAAHHSPAPVRGFRVCAQQLTVFFWEHSVWMLATNMNRFTAGSVELFHDVRLACATTERFVAENEFLIRHKRRLRHEEPFALAAKCTVLARVALA